MFDRIFYGFLGVFTILLLLVLVVTFGGSMDNQETTQEITSFSDLGCNDDVYDYVDPDTGVHYLIYTHKAYNAGMGGITPRLNPDGSIMVDEVEGGDADGK